MICPYCNGEATCRDSSLIYGRSYGPAWICTRYPECDAYVGCHPGTQKPLGRMANSELRDWKQRTHRAFDPLWKSGRMTRTAAYRWLAAQLGIAFEECHVGMFDVEHCRRAVEVASQALTEHKT